MGEGCDPVCLHCFVLTLCSFYFFFLMVFQRQSELFVKLFLTCWNFLLFFLLVDVFGEWGWTLKSCSLPSFHVIVINTVKWSCTPCVVTVLVKYRVGCSVLWVGGSYAGRRRHEGWWLLEVFREMEGVRTAPARCPISPLPLQAVDVLGWLYVGLLQASVQRVWL